MPIDYEVQSEILKALGHPVRLKIVEGLINEGGCNVNKIVENLGLPQSTISQHLGILKSKKIIVPKKDGVKICYTVENDKILKLIELLG